MGPIFIVVAINIKRGWLRTICFLIPIIGSVAGVVGAGEMVFVALLYQAIGWIVWIAVGYAIRFGIRYVKQRLEKQ